MRNVRLVIAYDGTDFRGWQRQPAQPTIQATLETAIEKILSESVTAWASGRTDAGVHAANQVVNFKTACPIPCANLVKALNNLLPVSVRVKEAAEVAESFHARTQVRAKTYRYRILLAPVASPFIARYAYHYPLPLDRGHMEKAARLYEGERDFTSFAASEGPGEGSARAAGSSAVRRIFSSRIIWRPRARILIYEVRGSGFLHHMVRNIVGTLIEVGRGRIEPREVLRILDARDRRLAGPTAPPHGLCLWKVEY
jgi:tRNA pseudouridine38-40 synthase